MQQYTINRVARNPTAHKVLPGLDALRAGFDGEILRFLQTSRAGLLTNHTGCALDGTPALQVLRDLNINISTLFSPEHGPSGVREGDIESSQTSDGLPIFSLYGATRRPTPKMLQNLDVVICDLQDVGVRFYTYSTTLAYLLEECAPRGIAVIVLDRPNPLGGEIIEGPELQPECRSFVGHLNIPIRHGLTLGELAKLHCNDCNLNIDLKVVPAQNWRHKMLWPDTNLEWRTPSPNLPDFYAAAWYPGLCLLEFSSVSVGRGTEAPFQILGAPWLQPQKVVDAMRAWPQSLKSEIRPEILEFTPTRATFENEPCRGLYFKLQTSNFKLPAQPVALGLALLATLRQTHPKNFGDEQLQKSLPLLGSPQVLELLRAGDLQNAMVVTQADAKKFAARRAKFLIY